MTQPPYPQQPGPEGQPPAPQNPQYPNPQYPNPGQPQHPPAGGQYPGYQSGGQYPGYQGAPPPPSGYGAGGGMPPPPSGYGAGGGMPPPPPGWGAPPQQPVARPPTVTYAFYALLANLVLGLIAAVLIFSNQDAYIDQALIDAGLDPDSASASTIVDSAYTIGAVIGLVFVALWAMFLWFAWKGHNWARIVIWVLGGLSLLGIFSAFSSPVGIVVVVNVLSLLLTITAIVLLALKPSNEWYRYQGNARKYGWPGRA